MSKVSDGEKRWGYAGGEGRGHVTGAGSRDWGGGLAKRSCDLATELYRPNGGSNGSNRHSDKRHNRYTKRTRVTQTGGVITGGGHATVT